MKLQELIDYLEIAKQKVGANVDVYLYPEDEYYRFNTEEVNEVTDVILKGEQSMITNKETDSTCLIIKYTQFNYSQIKMTYSQAENFKIFIDAFEYLSENNEMIADYYMSYYWDEETQEWDYEAIDSQVVKKIQKDVEYTVNA